MTFRERLADIISGGALSEAHSRIEWAERKIGGLEKGLRLEERFSDKISATAIKNAEALGDIMRATAEIKNGTGQKVYRMASEALGK